MVEITLVHMVEFSHGGNYIGSETFTNTILTVFNILFNNAALKYNLQASKNVKIQLIPNIFLFCYWDPKPIPDFYVSIFKF